MPLRFLPASLYTLSLDPHDVSVTIPILPTGILRLRPLTIRSRIKEVAERARLARPGGSYENAATKQTRGVGRLHGLLLMLAAIESRSPGNTSLVTPASIDTLHGALGEMLRTHACFFHAEDEMLASH